MGVKDLILLVVAGVAMCCPDETNCMQCHTDPKGNECRQCFHGFVRDRKCQLGVQAPISNCAYYVIKETDGLKFPVCERCDFGFYLQTDKCRKCSDPKCAVCDASGKCRGCKDGRIPDPKDQNKCSETKCSIRNCDVCVFEGEGPNQKVICAACAANSVRLEGNDAECLVSTIENCAVIKEIDSKHCEMCKEGFFITKDSQCRPNTHQEGGSKAWVMWLVLIVLLAALAAFLYERHVGFFPPKQEGLISSSGDTNVF
jgi:hypothetical protein